jgi:hypothetical protein
MGEESKITIRSPIGALKTTKPVRTVNKKTGQL